MVIVSLINQKGGCGKTTTAVNLSYALAKNNSSVLLIDLDPQAHATFSLGIKPKLTTADLLDNIISSKPFDLRESLITRANNLYVLPSSIGLSALEHSLGPREDKLDILSNFLSKYDLSFDYCIIDCPPNLGILTLNALVSSNYIIAPIGICELSLKGIENLNNILDMLSEHRGKRINTLYLITQLDGRYKFSKDFYNKVKNIFGNKLLSTTIRTNIHLREAAANGMSIFEYKKYSRGSHDYKQLADEIQNISGKPSAAKFILKGQEFNDVYLVGEFNNWNPDENYRLKKISADTWEINLNLEKGKYRYKFIVDGKWVNDPSNKFMEDDAFGGKNSIRIIS